MATLRVYVCGQGGQGRGRRQSGGGGGGINVRIGTRTSDEHKQVHGPYGIARSNSRGKNLVHILSSKDQQVEKAFSNYTQEDYVTYTSIHTTFTPTAFQSCTTSSCDHNPFTSKHMTAKQFLTVGAVLIKN